MKYLIIPEDDIKELETKRKLYYQSLKQDDVIEYIKASTLTGKVWYITHRRYKKLSLWNLLTTKLKGK